MLLYLLIWLVIGELIGWVATLIMNTAMHKTSL